MAIAWYIPNMHLPCRYVSLWSCRSASHTASSIRVHVIIWSTRVGGGVLLVIKEPSSIMHAAAGRGRGPAQPPRAKHPRYSLTLHPVNLMLPPTRAAASVS